MAASFANAFVKVKVQEAIEASPIILGKEQGRVFEVCADNEGGVPVFTKE